MDLRLYLELPWPQAAILPKAPSRQDINLFFKYYDPLKETLKYVGHLYGPKTFQVRPSARRSGAGGWVGGQGAVLQLVCLSCFAGLFCVGWVVLGKGSRLGWWTNSGSRAICHA